MRFMKHCKNILSILTIFILTSCQYAHDYYQERDPRLVKNQHFLLLVDDNTLELDYLKKITFGEIIVPAGMLSVSRETMKNLISWLVSKKYTGEIIDMALFADFHGPIEDWIIKKRAVKNLGIYYVENDSIKFDFYDLNNGKFQTYNELSGIYCDVYFPFLLEKSNVKKNPSMVRISLKRSDLPDKDEFKFASKKNDELHQILDRFHAIQK